MTPRIVISMGDPAGVGPEIVAKALSRPGIQDLAQWVVLGEAWAMEELRSTVGNPFTQFVDNLDGIDPQTRVALLDMQALSPHEREPVSAACGRASIEYVTAGTRMCQQREAHAIVTGPISKEAVTLSGMHSFCGHTEYIADLCGVQDSRLMLVHDLLCVVHVSTHCSLVEATKLSTDRILKTIQLGHEAVSRIRKRIPTVHVCGLNPHAGENGLFGDEERRFIIPAIQQAQESGIDCKGPFPADALFMQAPQGKLDLVVAMYHDQGHAPMKMLDFERTVNVTLGLPIIRTSVDHGTAFDIAGKNVAREESMVSALGLAVKLVYDRNPPPS